MPAPVRPDPHAAPAARSARAEVTALARAAGGSGIVFAALFVVALVLVSQGPGLDAPDDAYTAFFTSGRDSLLVSVGLYVVPFAGIAFLWHMVASRTYMQVIAPRSWARIPHWLHLASGVVFVALLFAGTATAGGAALLTRFSSAAPPPPDVVRTLMTVGFTMVFVYGVRVAGMFMITTTSGLGRTLPRPVAVVFYLAAAFLLVSTTFHPSVLLVFPGWVLVLSVLLLVRRAGPEDGATKEDTDEQ
ncbi:hypothetical protein LWC35_08590 [Pseudonocardia kujensis]|uniref:hypothetical protein n=1 Tax=Pseudonocardia kujensis TaxID=1128675 RepID=UPI001E34E289|nr:hypothetical protein [Pseudonocardia kujensis]MCE0762971.1 hypothetical protein [Pseudonocardia kujensis]